MALKSYNYPTATKNSPLKYLEYFLLKDSFEKFENNFFENPINESFKSFRDEGYVYYLETNTDNPSYVTKYFEKELERVVMLYLNESLRLILEKKEEIETTQENANIYLRRQLINLERIMQGITSFKMYQSLILSLLEKLHFRISELIETEKRNEVILGPIIGNHTFFGLKDEVRLPELKKIYDTTLDLNLINDQEVSESEFIKVFTSTSLPQEGAKIRFKKDNRTIGYYFQVISQLFESFTPREIQKSKSFYKKSGKLFNEGDINKVNNFLKNSNLQKYHYIREEIEKALSE